MQLPELEVQPLQYPGYVVFPQYGDGHAAQVE